MTTKNEGMRHISRALEAIPPLRGLQVDDPTFVKWKLNTQSAIIHTFGENSRQLFHFDGLGFRIRIVTDDHSRDAAINAKAYQDGLDRAQATRQVMLEDINLYWPDDGAGETATEKPETPERQASNRVFVVHGRDDGTRNTVARFLDTLGLEPVILQEQPNEGRTIIEKLEYYSNVAFAVVLCTTDDVGALASESDQLLPRARQNVLLELGYYVGRIGRDRVCALVERGVEIPSDLSGVVYVPLDTSEGWKLTLARELRAAGMTIDMNRIV